MQRGRPTLAPATVQWQQSARRRWGEGGNGCRAKLDRWRFRRSPARSKRGRKTSASRRDCGRSADRAVDRGSWIVDLGPWTLERTVELNWDQQQSMSVNWELAGSVLGGRGGVKYSRAGGLFRRDQDRDGQRPRSDWTLRHEDGARIELRARVQVQVQVQVQAQVQAQMQGSRALTLTAWSAGRAASFVVPSNPAEAMRAECSHGLSTRKCWSCPAEPGPARIASTTPLAMRTLSARVRTTCFLVVPGTSRWIPLGRVPLDTQALPGYKYVQGCMSLCWLSLSVARMTV